MFRIFISLLLFTAILPAATADEFGTKVPLNGATLANTKLQYDTLMPVYSAVGIRVRSCKDMHVTDTFVKKQPYNLKMENGQYTQGQWEEIWRVNACGKVADVPIKFVIDPTGTSYMISPYDISVK